MGLCMGLGWDNGDLEFEFGHPEESFLMDSKRPGLEVEEKTLLDLERELIDPVLFESYTVAGKL